MNTHAATFDTYYAASDDPWGFRSRWYERRKRALTRAMLPRDAYDDGWEMACSNGELAAALAPICRRLLASDGNAAAVAAAKDRLSATPNVAVEARWLPEDWPSQTFDLIVFSEVAYYLDRAQLDQICVRLPRTLSRGGTFLACHWRPRVENCALTGDEVHRILTDTLPWEKLARHEEKDFLMEVWSDDRRSVAETEGIR